MALKTLVRRERDVIARYWLVTIAPPAISTFLYFGVFGHVLGARIGEVHGVPFAEYMTSGLIALATIPAAFMHSAAGLLGARINGFIEEFLVAPAPRGVLLLGYVAGGVMRGLTVAAVATGIAVFFAGFRGMSIASTFGALFLVAFVAATGGFITGLLANTFERVSMTQGLILVPLAFLGGVFVPVDALPEWAHVVARANPVFYMVSAIRAGVTGVAEVSAAGAFGVVGVMAVVLFVTALRLVARRELRFHDSTR